MGIPVRYTLSFSKWQKFHTISGVSFKKSWLPLLFTHHPSLCKKPWTGTCSIYVRWAAETSTRRRNLQASYEGDNGEISIWWNRNALWKHEDEYTARLTNVWSRSYPTSKLFQYPKIIRQISRVFPGVYDHYCSNQFLPSIVTSFLIAVSWMALIAVSEPPWNCGITTIRAIAWAGLWWEVLGADLKVTLFGVERMIHPTLTLLHFFF